MAQWKTDEELFALIRNQLVTCPISDVLEQLGILAPMLPPEIHALRRDLVMVGRAMPVQDDLPVPYGTPERYDFKPFGLMLESIEDLKPNEVYIATGGPIKVARLGDMLVERAMKRGAAGVVVNAHVRDGNGIMSLGIPAYAHGTYAYGLQRRHNVVDFRCSIKIGDTRIRPGDLIFGDGDGVCVIPHEAEEEVINRALVKYKKESHVREEVEAGRSINDAFKKFGAM